MEENSFLSNETLDTQKNTLKSKSYAKLLFYVILLVFCFLFVFNFFFLKAPKDFPKESIQEIKTGSSLRSVSLHFKNLNLIKSRVTFETFVILYGDEKHILPGSYFFEKKLKVNQLAKRIADGDKQLAPLKITIPEGYDITQMATTFSKKLPHFNSENFLNKAKQGYLFPDTYFFSIEDSEDDVLDYMNKNFEKKFKDIREEIIKQGKNEKEILIMASILEREARGDMDREYVSGILWKRLSIGMALQVDAAPITYKERGLPNSPISNPGLEAIHASLYPKTTTYLYYLHDKEGMIHYARSFAEHKANIAKYLR
ncbi:MAG: hypothetical protein QG583_304 [Patescibacteria group bacterium]|nr:hypothetical protein [Patescibacteria group bacterium]